MEFPELGKNCASRTCNKLDFLPMKCDACGLIFCCDHIQYSTHSCTESYRKDNQVPVCPLCDKPIPLKPGETADVKVGMHMDTDCQSDPARERRKVYTNKCSKKGCKVKEIVRVTCDRCRKNFCLKHRHENDHDCTNPSSPVTAHSMAAAAAISRNKTAQRSDRVQAQSLSSHIGSTGAQARRVTASRGGQQVPVGGYQTGMSEEEALQRALQLSAAQQNTSIPQQSDMSQQELEDLQLAQALAASEREARTSQRNNSSEKSSCVVN